MPLPRSSKPSVLKAAPRKARALTGRGRLPDVKNLHKQTAEQLVRTLRRFNIEPDMKAVERRAYKAFESLEGVLEEGRQPDAAAWERIDKQLEREATQNLRKMTKAAIRNYKQSRVAQSSPAGRFAWITVGDVNVCKSCDPRHGQVKSMPQWKQVGLPGSAALVCAQECRCELLPA